MYGQTYEIDVTLRFDVTDGEAVRRTAWKLAAYDENSDVEGVNVVADQVAATTEGALSIIVSQGAWASALFELAEQVEGLSLFAVGASPGTARRVDDDEEDDDH